MSATWDDVEESCSAFIPYFLKVRAKRGGQQVGEPRCHNLFRRLHSIANDKIGRRPSIDLDPPKTSTRLLLRQQYRIISPKVIRATPPRTELARRRDQVRIQCTYSCTRVRTT